MAAGITEDLSTPRRGLTRSLAVVVMGAISVVVGIIMFAVRFQTHFEPTFNMDPAVVGGAQVVMDTSVAGQAERGQIVLVNREDWPGNNNGVRSLLRVVAIGGDRVVCCDAAGRITVNGALPGPNTVSGELPGSPAFDITVPNGRVFVLGDARERTRDSRAFLDIEHGTLSTSRIEGRAVAAIRPLKSAGQLEGAPVTYLYVSVALTALGVLLILVQLVVAIRRLRRRGRSASQPSW